MPYKIFLAAACTALLASCASAPMTPLTRPAKDAQCEVVVFREYAFAAGGVSLSVGTGSGIFANLSNTEQVRALLPVGEHEVFVQARNADPTRMRVTVRKDATVCLRTSSSPWTAVKAAVPIVLIATGYHFYLDEVPCPSAADMAKYKDIEVAYR